MKIFFILMEKMGKQYSQTPLHAQIQEFACGGGAVQVSLTKKSSDNGIFFSPLLFFFFLQKSNGQFQRDLTFFKVPEGVQHFPGGGGSNFILGGGGGGNCLFPIETHITCDFPGGFRTPANPPPPPPPPPPPCICTCFEIPNNV